MKYAIMLLLVCNICKAQSISQSLVITGDYWTGGHKLGDMDTVKSIFLCIDTFVHYHDGGIMGWKNNGSFYAYGYNVYKWVSDNYNEQHWWQLVQYLDSDKKPMKDFIWLSKELK